MMQLPHLYRTAPAGLLLWAAISTGCSHPQVEQREMKRMSMEELKAAAARIDRIAAKVTFQVPGKEEAKPAPKGADQP